METGPSNASSGLRNVSHSELKLSPSFSRGQWDRERVDRQTHWATRCSLGLHSTTQLLGQLPPPVLAGHLLPARGPKRISPESSPSLLPQRPQPTPHSSLSATIAGPSQVHVERQVLGALAHSQVTRQPPELAQYRTLNCHIQLQSQLCSSVSGSAPELGVGWGEGPNPNVYSIESHWAMETPMRPGQGEARGLCAMLGP